MAAEFRPMFMRRSRGYVPASIPLPDPAARPILACGAELKSTFCVAKGSRAWVSHHIGDLQNYETLRSFTDGIEHFERLFSVQPEVIVHDLHPEYLSTKYALELEVERSTDGRRGVVSSGSPFSTTTLTWRRASPSTASTGIAVGAIFDGTGYGTDGTVWGGELLVGDLADFRRAGALRRSGFPAASARSASRGGWLAPG